MPIVLGGGSAFGLDAASGSGAVLGGARHIGYRAGPVTVPIVPAAILFDMGIAKTRRSSRRRRGVCGVRGSLRRRRRGGERRRGDRGYGGEDAGKRAAP